MEREIRQAFSKKVCIVPDQWKNDCVGPPIRAPTVPKSSSLKKIARNGHVYGYVPAFAKLTQHGGRVPPELVGINKASTFTGFCGKHDTTLFAPLETMEFRASPHQCFLLGYRALALEVNTKEASAALSDVRRRSDKGRTEDEQFAIQSHNFSLDVGLAAGLRDNEHHLNEMDGYLLRNDFGSVRAYVIQLREPPPVMCSGGIFPEQTFDGEQLHDLSDPSERGNLLSISSFWGGLDGYVVLSWLPDSDIICVPFVASLSAIPDSSLGAALLRLFFEYLENIYMSPDWWEALDESKRQYLNRRMWSIVDQFAGTRQSGDIRADGVEFEPWPIVARFWVGECGSNKAMQPTGEDASG